MDKANVGTIFNVQKYSVHDGPGIRTSVFFKGCPLSCWWCHNPESQDNKIQLMHFTNKCTSCGKCVANCPNDAITLDEKGISIDKEKCTLSGHCADVCAYGAMEITGREISAKDLIKEIRKDEVFYEQSDGGVTFTGGEPLNQIDFLTNVSKQCHDVDIHTTLDTCLFTSWDNLLKIVPYIDLFLVDLKHIDSDIHKKYVGVPNELILDNMKKLSDLGKRIFVRMPIIPGINDSVETIDKTIEFLKTINFEQVNLLPYHKIGMDKYTRLQEDYKLKDVKEPTMDEMQKIVAIFKNNGINVKIGG